MKLFRMASRLVIVASITVVSCASSIAKIRSHEKVSVQVAKRGPAKSVPATLRGKIIYAPAAKWGQARELWCINSDGTGNHKFWSVPPHVFGSVDQFAVSPDRTHIAFTAVRMTEEAYEGNRLWISNVDGSSRRALSASDISGLEWSPDGKTILYNENSGAHSGGPGTLYSRLGVVNVAGQTVSHIGTFADFLCCAQWSRNGKRIRFSMVKGGAPESPEAPAEPYELHSANRDGSNEHVSTREDIQIADNSLSPDGKRCLALQRPDGLGGAQVFVYAAGKGPARQITFTAGTKLAARFAADGRHVIYLDQDEAGFYRVQINLDGSAPTRLLRGNCVIQKQIQFVQWLQ